MPRCIGGATHRCSECGPRYCVVVSVFNVRYASSAHARRPAPWESRRGHGPVGGWRGRRRPTRVKARRLTRRCSVRPVEHNQVVAPRNQPPQGFRRRGELVDDGAGQGRARREFVAYGALVDQQGDVHRCDSPVVDLGTGYPAETRNAKDEFRAQVKGVDESGADEGRCPAVWLSAPIRFAVVGRIAGRRCNVPGS